MYLIFICAEDGKRMHLVKGKFGLFYRCPNHLYPQQEKELKRKSCPGRLTIAAADVIETFVERAEKDGTLERLINEGITVKMKACDVRFRMRSDQICEAVIKRTKHKRSAKTAKK